MHIKNRIEHAIPLYINELLHLSELYDGSFTFYLVVEEDVCQYQNDFPSTFGAIFRLRSVLDPSELIKFDESPSFHIADGGNKIRSKPYSDWYGFQGLIPFVEDGTRSYLHEIIIRTGTLFIQLPDVKDETFCKYHITASSDSICVYSGMQLLGGKEIGVWDRNRKPLLLLLHPTDDKNTEDKVMAITRKRKIETVLAKYKNQVFQHHAASYDDKGYYTLPFVMVWTKDFLNKFVKTSYSYLNRQVDFFKGWIESLYTDNPLMIDLDRTARSLFGTRGDRLEFGLMQPNSFRDEGHYTILDRRIFRGGLKRDDYEILRVNHDMPKNPETYSIDRILSLSEFSSEIISEIQHKLKAKKDNTRPFWVLLEGIQCSGKSTLADRLVYNLEAAGFTASKIEEDWWHFPRDSRPNPESCRSEDYHRKNWHRWNELFACLKSLDNGNSISFLKYNPDDGKLAPQTTFQCPAVLIYTGFYCFDYFTRISPDILADKDSAYRIYMYTGFDESLCRKLRRDTWRNREERHLLHTNIYLPSFQQHIKNTDYAKISDRIVHVRLNSLLF